MATISLLIQYTPLIEDGNYLRFGNELIDRGHTVNVCMVDSLHMFASKIAATGFALSAPLRPGDHFPSAKQILLQDSDIVWVLGLGLRQSFLDKLQLLYSLENFCSVINSPSSILNLKSKYSLAAKSDIFQYPLTHASSDPDALYQLIENSGHKWIAKPPAGSMGRDIFLLSAEDANTRVILETMTGPDSDKYCLLQAYVDEIAAGEKRVLFAAGEVVGQYRRRANKDHRTNLVQGAKIDACDLNEEEQLYCQKIGRYLKSEGAAFVGMDLAFPFVIEFNVINPGGVLTIESLGGGCLAGDIVNRIITEAI